MVLPHQLFSDFSWISQDSTVFLVEEPLFFKDAKYPVSFHAKKLILHRASMKAYEERLSAAGYSVTYMDTSETLISELFESLAGQQVTVIDPVDFELSKRIRESAQTNSCVLDWQDSALFINTSTENAEYRSGKKRWFMADFYKYQRRRLNILMDGPEPFGGKWSYDEENRKKIPKKEIPNIPELTFAAESPHIAEAATYVASTFPGALGSSDNFEYPVTHEEAELWLKRFLTERFDLFGPYEDALVKESPWLYHSVLTPMLNIGLLTPRQVVDHALEFAALNDVRINSVEGFVRQIIGWREFMRATYEDLGVEMRTSNSWGHTKPMPSSFYDASTGIEPVDDVIGRVVSHSYCHHIERLMVLGGFMFLCEISPKEIYTWFMELFIDAYDWVMVPNVYGMSQNSDGGLITTKPYFSGSAYIKKMGYPAGDWGPIWDGLYWRWINKNHNELAKNHRWSMMCAQVRKMDSEKLDTHLQNAEEFLAKLHD